jgi:hypothetical protein
MTIESLEISHFEITKPVYASEQRPRRTIHTVCHWQEVQIEDV